MGRKLLLVNILILIGIILLARHITTAWQEYERNNNLAAVLAKANQNRPKDAAITAPPAPEEAPPFNEFAVIPEKDLFVPDRRPQPIEVAETVVEKPPQLARKPSLNGVMTNGGKKQALITVFEGQNPKGQTRMVGVGDDLQGYTVSEITDTTLKMRWKDTEVLVDMFDAAPQQGAAASPPRNASAAVTVVTIGSSASPVETSGAGDSPSSGDKRVGEGTAASGVGRPGGQPRAGGNPAVQGAPAAGAAGTVGTGVLGGRSGAGSVPFNTTTRRRNR